jgi:hypothetical protein
MGQLEKCLVCMPNDLDAARNAILQSLALVGPTKPIGYLPLYTIRDVLKMEPQSLARDAEARGLSASLFGADLCCIESGALYLFDRQSLWHLLQSSRAILLANHWPLDPLEFVARIAREWIDPSHPVAPVINRAFGEGGP